MENSHSQSTTLPHQPCWLQAGRTFTNLRFLSFRYIAPQQATGMPHYILKSKPLYLPRNISSVTRRRGTECGMRLQLPLYSGSELTRAPRCASVDKELIS